MTTRAQAKAAARPTRARKASTSTSTTTGEKENKVTPAKSKVNGTAARAGPKEKKTKGKEKPRYCLCKGDDDGTPMVFCCLCENWYHFRCVDLTEEEAENIQLYVCPPCTEKTGRCTVMEGEGPEALEPGKNIPKVSVNGLSPKETTPVVPKVEESEESEGEKPEPAEVSESSGDGTEDEYVDESEQAKPHSKKSMGKRPTRRVAVSDSESDSGSDTKTASTSRPRQPSVSVAQKSKSSTRIMSVSPPPSPLKRKPSSAAPPPPKRRRSESTATDDPTRKYCHGKLAEMFIKIFLDNPRFKPADGDGMLVEKKPEELSDEDKNILQEKAKAFAAELEQCLFDTYADPDKHGRHVASTKYKERFRMITFNLPQADRAHLHKQIVNGELTPAKISVMSSTDLASEEIQQSIKAAEQEALQHSILQKSTLPRAKITHKGLQDIEDPNEEMTRQREREIARELEEEEQERREKGREKERLARLPVVPPESPVTPHAPVSWGAPPPVPTQAVQGEASFMPGRPPIHIHPLFEPSASEMQPLEHEELNLGDLIHIDEEPSGEAHEEPKNEPLEPRLPTPVLQEEPKLPSGSPEAAQPSKSRSPKLSRSPTAPSSPNTTIDNAIFDAFPSVPQEMPRAYHSIPPAENGAPVRKRNPADVPTDIKHSMDMGWLEEDNGWLSLPVAAPRPPATTRAQAENSLSEQTS
ncbi:hypothetical protein EWM64_g9573 [Hericium alpestre]|uniref:Transcription factor BYE1 n=1 Tax=Hericium alpestre TaxID=135208 RepID=A0A4Y9ZLY4_9AGAM|nr:hypothetical protein EWM64_g9573 [Hericium alpestre]